MKVYAAHKNNSIIKGKLFALPEQAFNFFCEEFLKIYPNAKIGASRPMSAIHRIFRKVKI